MLIISWQLREINYAQEFLCIFWKLEAIFFFFVSAAVAAAAEKLKLKQLGNILESFSKFLKYCQVIGVKFSKL